METKHLIELIDLQYKLTKGLSNLIETWKLTDEEKKRFHEYLFAYMDVFSGHVLEKKLSLPDHIQNEVKEWFETYSDEERMKMFDLYHEISDVLLNQTGEVSKT